MLDTILTEAEIRELIRVIMFGLAAVIGMFAAYTIRWSEGAYKTIGFMAYMWNPPAIGRAFVALLTLCLGAGGLDYLESLRGIHILIAGAGIGYLVPRSVDNAS